MTNSTPKWESNFIKKFVNNHGDRWRPLRGLWVEEVVDFIRSTRAEAVKEERNRIKKLIPKEIKPISKDEKSRGNEMDICHGYNACRAKMLRRLEERKE